MNYQTNNGNSTADSLSDDIENVSSNIPSYLQEVYHWAYLNERNAKLLDREFIVSAILWGNSKRLRQAVLDEVIAGSYILQVAHVYGTLIPELAKTVGEGGALEVIDIAPLQVSLCKKKLEAFSSTHVHIADASTRGSGNEFDLVNCFFLLHEVPDDLKVKIVNTVLSQVAPNGKAIFVDYHQPHKWHPIRGFMQFIFRHLEPFAESLFHSDIKNMATSASNFTWHKRTIFGGLYQIIVATRTASA